MDRNLAVTHSLSRIHNAQELQEERKISGAFAQTGRIVLAPRQAKDVENSVANRGQHIEPESAVHAAAVFTEDVNADVEHTVLDPQVTAVDCQHMI